MKSLIIPILLIILGVGWLLTSLRVVPEVNWVWTLGVAFVGILTFVLSGIDKVSVAVGPFFMFASGLSILRQTGRLNINLEVPILVILAGILLIVARLRCIPAPTWLIESQTKTDSNR